jgi:hypothetical protein
MHNSFKGKKCDAVIKLPSPQSSRIELFFQKHLVLWTDEIEDVIFE